MSRNGTWSFATASGSVEVAPDEIRVRKRVPKVLFASARAIRQGRLPPVARHVGWSEIGAAFTALGALLQYAWSSGVALSVTGLGLAGAVASLGAATVRSRRTDVPLRDVRHVAFEGDEVVVVYDERDEGGDGTDGEGPATYDEADEDAERTETRVRPIDDATRGDAALAFRLRGVDVRGVEEDDAVSRTAVDAPKTELLE